MALNVRILAKVEPIRALLASGQLDRALASARQLLTLAPRESIVQSLLREIHEARGEGELAAHFATRAAEQCDDSPEEQADLWIAAARVLELLGRFDESAASARRAMALVPGHPSPITALAQCLLTANRLTEAEGVIREGLARCGDWPPLLRRLGGVLLESGRAEEAIAVWDRLVAGRPDAVEPLDTLVQSERAANRLYAAPADGADALRRAREFAAHLLKVEGVVKGAVEPAESSTAGSAVAVTSPPPLRVGLLSSDLRTHSVAFFVRPLLRALCTRQRDRAMTGRRAPELSGVIYDTSGSDDAMAVSLRALADELGWLWRTCAGPGISSRQLAGLIASDGLDVLIELNGLSTGHRHDALVHRPARRVVSYLGYAGTTGMPHVGFRLVDEQTDPVATSGGGDGQSSERLVRMAKADGSPHPFLLYELPENMPAPVNAISMNGTFAEPSERSQGSTQSQPPFAGITFGSFNNITKTGDAACELFASVLRSAPGSRFAFKGYSLEDAGVRSRVIDRFARRGVEPSRIVFLPWSRDYRDHLPLYAKVDIALDTWPYSGTTTTFEALAMGVPVVTLCQRPEDGGIHASRVTGAILRWLGRPEWVAEDATGFVRVAVALAKDRSALARVRATLRDELLASPMCDRAGFAEALVETLRRINTM